MVNVEFYPSFSKAFSKIKDHDITVRVKKQMRKILADPEIGKPMQYARKGTRELYIPPFRLSYIYLKEEGKILFFYLYHKDEQ